MAVVDYAIANPPYPVGNLNYRLKMTAFGTLSTKETTNKKQPQKTSIQMGTTTLHSL